MGPRRRTSQGMGRVELMMWVGQEGVSMPEFISTNIALIVLVGIVLVGLLGVGLKDVLRFSVTRAWAISGVCFQQSIRRRVLWLTPLVILGVLTVAQFQKPIDPQDAVRQTTSCWWRS